MSAEVIRILFIGVSPRDTGRLRIDKEHRIINKIIHSSKLRERITLNTELALPANELVSVIHRTDPTVIHFSGHGGEEGIVLEDQNGEGQTVSPEALTRMFSGFLGRIQCVILNSCFSLSLAERLMRQSQVACVIGLSSAIDDEDAIAFVAQLYQFLCDGEAVARAMQLAKMSLSVSGVEGTDIINCVNAPDIDPETFGLEQMAERRSASRAPALIPRVLHLVQEGIQQGEAALIPNDLSAQSGRRSGISPELAETRRGLPEEAALALGRAEGGRVDPLSARHVALENGGTAPLGASQTPEFNVGESPATPVLVGQGLDFRREAEPHELCLSVDQYVDALATVIGQAEGELCFALYGNWGRGKTTLALRLCEVLKQKRERPSYRTIWFNAWKYRSPPEVWAHLYERMAHGLGGDGWVSALPRVLRANLSRRGLGIITLALLWLSISLVPIGDKVDLALKVIVGLVGSLGLVAIWAMSAVYKTSSVTRRIWQLYAALPSHEDKLGLQAAIGGDLLHMLRGWIPRYYKRARSNAEHAVHAVHAGPRLQSVDDGVARDHTPKWGRVGAFALMVLLVGAVSWLALGRAAYLPPWVRWAIPVGWVVLCLIFSIWVWLGGRQVDRLLIVIDDLDRCPQEQMLDILEAIKLLAEEPGIRERLQVLVLVDEDVLGQAIQYRFRHLRAPGNSPAPADLRREVRDHLRKLFLGNLRLGPLSLDDVSDLVARYTRTQPGPATPAESPGQKADPLASGRGLTEGRRPLIAGDRMLIPANEPAVSAGVGTRPPPIRQAEGRNVDSVLFTPDETMILTIYAQRLLQAGDAERLGPRTIRSFIFRYQLARLLLRSLRIEADANSVARYLYDTTDMDSRYDRKKTAESMLHEQVQRVLAQIAELAELPKGGEEHQASLSSEI